MLLAGQDSLSDVSQNLTGLLLSLAFFIIKEQEQAKGAHWSSKCDICFC